MIKVDYILRELLKGETPKESKKDKESFFLQNANQGKLIILFYVNYQMLYDSE